MTSIAISPIRRLTLTFSTGVSPFTTEGIKCISSALDEKVIVVVNRIARAILFHFGVESPLTKRLRDHVTDHDLKKSLSHLITSCIGIAIQLNKGTPYEEIAPLGEPVPDYQYGTTQREYANTLLTLALLNFPHPYLACCEMPYPSNSDLSITTKKAAQAYLKVHNHSVNTLYEHLKKPGDSLPDKIFEENENLMPWVYRASLFPGNYAMTTVAYSLAAWNKYGSKYTSKPNLTPSPVLTKHPFYTCARKELEHPKLDNVDLSRFVHLFPSFPGTPNSFRAYIYFCSLEILEETLEWELPDSVCSSLIEVWLEEGGDYLRHSFLFWITSKTKIKTTDLTKGEHSHPMFKRARLLFNILKGHVNPSLLATPSDPQKTALNTLIIWIFSSDLQELGPIVAPNYPYTASPSSPKFLDIPQLVTSVQQLSSIYGDAPFKRAALSFFMCLSDKPLPILITTHLSRCSIYMEVSPSNAKDFIKNVKKYSLENLGKIRTAIHSACRSASGLTTRRGERSASFFPLLLKFHTAFPETLPETLIEQTNKFLSIFGLKDKMHQIDMTLFHHALFKHFQTPFSPKVGHIIALFEHTSAQTLPPNAKLQFLICPLSDPPEEFPMIEDFDSRLPKMNYSKINVATEDPLEMLVLKSHEINHTLRPIIQRTPIENSSLLDCFFEAHYLPECAHHLHQGLQHLKTLETFMGHTLHPSQLFPILFFPFSQNSIVEIMTDLTRERKALLKSKDFFPLVSPSIYQDRIRRAFSCDTLPPHFHPDRKEIAKAPLAQVHSELFASLFPKKPFARSFPVSVKEGALVFPSNTRTRSLSVVNPTDPYATYSYWTFSNHIARFSFTLTRNGLFFLGESFLSTPPDFNHWTDLFKMLEELYPLLNSDNYRVNPNQEQSVLDNLLANFPEARAIWETSLLPPYIKGQIAPLLGVFLKELEISFRTALFHLSTQSVFWLSDQELRQQSSPDFLCRQAAKKTFFSVDDSEGNACLSLICEKGLSPLSPLFPYYSVSPKEGCISDMSDLSATAWESENETTIYLILNDKTEVEVPCSFSSSGSIPHQREETVIHLSCTFQDTPFEVSIGLEKGPKKTQDMMFAVASLKGLLYEHILLTP